MVMPTLLCVVRLVEAAFELGGSPQMKLAALEDEDLRPLWDHIGEL